MKKTGKKMGMKVKVCRVCVEALSRGWARLGGDREWGVEAERGTGL